MKRLLKIVGIFLALVVIIAFVFSWMVYLPNPEVSNEAEFKKISRTPIANGWQYHNNWIRKNDFGLYEMYVEGEPFERGYINGLLAQELVYKQEKSFKAQIDKMIPSSFYQQFLKYFIAFFNRDLDDNISEEYKQEIYGVSRFASDEFELVGPAYQRILNYHGAHDIGHAMQTMSMVGCTSFGLWNEYTSDSSIIIGRNFDFYVGEDFAEDKIIQFTKPDKGHGFMMVTWGGMIGVVSGMNEKGLTVTLNAGPSEMPLGTATPVSIIAREVLQYASTIDEAYKIIESRKAFVAELYMIGSAADNNVAIIEKTTVGTSIYFTPTQGKILCTNHFQSDSLSATAQNTNQIASNPTMYRMDRLKELIDAKSTFNPVDIATILRDPYGKKGANVGFCNEAAVNQFLAHHSIIFKPKEKLVWVSSNPYQLGAYVCYNLRDIFSGKLKPTSYLYDSTRTIAKDSILNTTFFSRIMEYKKKANEWKDAGYNVQLTQEEEKAFVALNEYNYDTYLILARIAIKNKNYSKAQEYIQLAKAQILSSGKEVKEIDNILQTIHDAQ